MRILVSGSTGLVGSALIPALVSGGHEVVRLVRSQASPPDRAIRWDPASGFVDSARLEGIEGVVHLAGESIASGRWTEAKKSRIRDSRVLGTRLLSEALARAAAPPRVMACASAIGFYGDRGDERLTEASPAGQGFLPDVCREWEAAARPAEESGIRVVSLRFGVILSRWGGALARMLTPFRLGAGGRIGSGRQHMSWIAVDDAVGAIGHALTQSLAGPINVVSPQPITNLEFTRALGRALSRPTILPMPALAAKLAFGEMAEALLLASARVEPARLAGSGFRFRHPELGAALRHVLGSPSPASSLA